MGLKPLIIVIFVTVSVAPFSNGQGMNLLQQYIRRYFKEYRPSTVRQYTLYGNGQPGAADFHAGLPYAFDTEGKVQSLIYSTASNPPLKNPKMSSKDAEGVVGNTWTNPGPADPTFPYQVSNQPGILTIKEGMPYVKLPGFVVNRMGSVPNWDNYDFGGQLLKDSQGINKEEPT